MAFAQGSRTQLTYVVESSFGTTPGTPSMIELPFTTHSLDLSKNRVEGRDIQSDRMPRIDRHGTRNVVGNIVADLRDGDYDDLIESAFFSTFDSSGVITIGTSQQFLTIEDGAEDVSEYRQFVGCGVNSMALSIAPDQMVETTFSIIGKDLTQAATSLDASPTAPSGTEPFDSFSGSIQEGGGASSIISAISFTLSNSLAPTHTVGSNTTGQLEFGRAVVEGTLSAYYEDETLINKFLNETASSIQVALTSVNTGGTYTFLIPNVKYNGAAVPVTDPQSRIIELPFVGIYDATEDTNLKITKT